MPTLPTLTIDNQVIWDRLLAAFNGDANEYREWLKKALRDELERREVKAIITERDIDIKQRSTELKGYLDGAT